MIRRLWTESEPFDFDGSYIKLTGAFGNPKPVQRPHPPILIGGRSSALLRVVAEHAGLWNIPGGDIDDVVERSALLDRYCLEVGRDPARSSDRSICPFPMTSPRRPKPPSEKRSAPRIRAHRPRAAGPLSRQSRAVGLRRVDHHVGLDRLDNEVGSFHLGHVPGGRQHLETRPGNGTGIG